MTTVCILGAGRIAAYHAEGFRRAGARIVGIADVRADAANTLALRYGAAAAADEGALLSLRPEVMVIATPHDLHVPQATRALESGVDVFLDKPLALTAKDGEALADLAAGLGRNLGVNHNMLFHPAVLEARTHLPGIGRLVSASAWSEGWLDITPWDFRLDRARTGGGAWFDAGPHLLYTLDALCGPFAELRGLTATGESRLGGEDTVVASGRFASGAVASLRVSYAYTGPGSRLAWPAGWHQGFELHGTEGALRILVTPVGQSKPLRRRTTRGLSARQTWPSPIHLTVRSPTSFPSAERPVNRTRLVSPCRFFHGSSRLSQIPVSVRVHPSEDRRC